MPYSGAVSVFVVVPIDDVVTAFYAPMTAVVLEHLLCRCHLWRFTANPAYRRGLQRQQLPGPLRSDDVSPQFG